MCLANGVRLRKGLKVGVSPRPAYELRQVGGLLLRPGGMHLSGFSRLSGFRRGSRWRRCLDNNRMRIMEHKNVRGGIHSYNPPPPPPKKKTSGNRKLWSLLATAVRGEGLIPLRGSAPRRARVMLLLLAIGRLAHRMGGEEEAARARAHTRGGRTCGGGRWRGGEALGDSRPGSLRVALGTTRSIKDRYGVAHTCVYRTHRGTPSPDVANPCRRGCSVPPSLRQRGGARSTSQRL